MITVSEEWECESVECDVCSFKWMAVYPVTIIEMDGEVMEHYPHELECKVCKHMVHMADDENEIV